MKVVPSPSRRAASFIALAPPCCGRPPSARSRRGRRPLRAGFPPSPVAFPSRLAGVPAHPPPAGGGRALAPLAAAVPKLAFYSRSVGEAAPPTSFRWPRKSILTVGACGCQRHSVGGAAPPARRTRRGSVTTVAAGLIKTGRASTRRRCLSLRPLARATAYAHSPAKGKFAFRVPKIVKKRLDKVAKICYD